MNMLTEQELSDALHRAVGDPGDDTTDRAAAIRRRAYQLRRRNATVVAAVLVVTVIVAIPTWLSLRGSTSISPGRPAANPSANVCSSAGCPADVLARLHRPLNLPVVQPGQPCPVSPTRQFPAGGGFSQEFVASGKGPVYLSGHGDISISPAPDKTPDQWGDSKVVWVFDAAYEGPLLFRGAQIDGNHGLRFDRYLGTMGYADGPPVGSYREVVYLHDGWAQHGPGFYTYPGSLRLQAAGCFALQIDGINLSETLVFEANG